MPLQVQRKIANQIINNGSILIAGAYPTPVLNNSMIVWSYVVGAFQNNKLINFTSNNYF
jgi:hypothetical protein